MSELSFLEKLLDGAEVEWLPLGQITQYSKTRINTDTITEDNYVGVDNLLQNKAGKITSNHVPTEGNVIEYCTGDTLIGNIRPYLKKVWHADRNGGTNGDVLVVQPTLEALNARYLYYALSDDKFFAYNMQHAKGAKMPRGNKNKILDYIIPIPCPEDPKKSLEIQGEIVQILDAFTALTAELTAELSARKKQYNYYRDQLFTFDENEVPHLPMGQDDIGEFIRGGGLQKKDFTETGVGCIHYGQVYTHYGTYAYETKSFVSEDFAKKARIAKTGDLIIATTSENDEDVCKAVAWLGDDDIAISSDACFYRHNLNPKYVAYFFQTEQFQAQKRQYITGAKVRRVNASNLAKILIPVPSAEEQARIVAILDKFDALTNSISDGLPYEIELRNKQYEYYRDLLLNFPKSEEAA